MIQNALTCGKLSSISLAIASVRMFSRSRLGPGRCSISEPSGMNGSGMIVWKYPPGLPSDPSAFFAAASAISGVGSRAPGFVSVIAPTPIASVAARPGSMNASLSSSYPSRDSA